MAISPHLPHPHYHLFEITVRKRWPCTSSTTSLIKRCSHAQTQEIAFLYRHYQRLNAYHPFGKLEVAKLTFDAINDLKETWYVTELRYVLGLWNAFHRFVPDFARCRATQAEAPWKLVTNLCRSHQQRESCNEYSTRATIIYTYLIAAWRRRPMHRRYRCLRQTSWGRGRITSRTAGRTSETN